MEKFPRYFIDMGCPDFRLDDLVVHVWRIFFPQLGPYENQLESVISDEEMAWSQRFKLPENRSLFILRKGLLRTLIRNYTGIRADRVEFYHSAWGKPCLSKDMGIDNFEFSVAYSRDGMILAFGKDLSVGVDLEYVDKNYPVMKIATRFFTPNESAVLRDVDPDRLQELFFEIWVRKEAFLKAIGRGLSLPLDSFEVPLNTVGSCAEEPPLKNATIEMDGNLWFVSDITFRAFYKACLATSLPPSAIRIFDWPSCMGI
jgi:4'-phosphopantetheinyl transferase